ncbi:MAG: HlyD family type I secretion periplasmic adaptor subunit [Methylohalobius sp. ZOD2]|nr:HlyD family type I secretion periplasmic adaptor subunit [Methylothermaceae bacterium]
MAVEKKVLSVRVSEPITGKTPDIEVPAIPPDDIGRFVRLGVWLLAVGFGGFLTWTALAPLDAGVPAPGTAVVESNRKTVAHLTGGIVKAIHVTEAQYVKSGQPLITLDDTEIAASYRSALKEYYALLAMEARLRAERQGAESVAFPGELLEAGSEGRANLQIEAQRQLFSARRSALDSELRLLAARVDTHTADADAKAAQLEFLREQLEGVRNLAAEGYAPRNARLELERQALDLGNQIDLARREAQDTRLEALRLKQNYRKEVETQLADTVRQAVVAEEKVRALKEALERTVIRAPVAGFVNHLEAHTVGGVVKPGEPMMEIVPRDERLLFEARIPSHLIDRIQAGQLADIQLQAFVNRPQLIVEGRVISVSADLIQSANSDMPPHYLARVEVTEAGLEQLGHHRLQPGMPATVIVKTGERTFLAYLLRPLLSRLHVALTEE